MKCFNCKQDGHIARECPWEKELAVPAPAVPFTLRQQSAPPSASYLAAKAEMGIPTDPFAAELLAVACPWCGSGPWQHCVNRALGMPKERAHDARYEAAGLSVPLRPALADAARRQADEARAVRAGSASQPGDFPGGLPLPPDYPAQ